VTGYCNGTLIDAYTLISAAHCFQRSEIGAGKKMRIEIGEYRYIVKDGVKIKIGYRAMIKHDSSVKVRVLPGVNLNGTATIPPELDIAVVKLDQPVAVPAEFVYAPIWNTALPGLNAASKLSIVSINIMETISHNDTKQMAVLNKFTQGRINIESTSTSRVAQGDSGAPLFAMINGKTYLIGVVKGTVSTFGSTRDIFVTLQGRINLQ
ncbi:MAG: trypsin-like serine protease, partial [Pseudobdellovibrio sp.]